MVKIQYALEVALLSFQVLGTKPLKGKTPLVTVLYAGLGEDPFASALAVAQAHGFKTSEVELPEGIAWRGAKTVLNGSGLGGQVFTATIQIIHSARVATPVTEPLAVLPTVEPEAASATDTEAT